MLRHADRGPQMEMRGDTDADLLSAIYGDNATKPQEAEKVQGVLKLAYSGYRENASHAVEHNVFTF